MLKECITKTEIYVKPTDSQQYLEASSCHPFDCKRGITYNQPLRLNHICSNNEYLNNRFNDLERFLTKRDYISQMVQAETLGAIKVSIGF